MRKLILALLLSGVAFAQMPMGGVTVATAAGGGGTTVVYQSNCSGSSSAAVGNCTFAAWPTSGYQVIGVVWLPSTATLSSVCDGTGADGCTGSSTYTLQPAYSNGTNFKTYVFYTCNFQGTSGTSDISLNFSGTAQYYTVAVSASGGTTTGTACNDGYNKAQSTTAGTSWTSGTVATTNANDLMVGLFSNNCGVTSFTAGTDGAGHTYTDRVNNNLVVSIETLSETATGTYSAAATSGSSCVWNAEIMAIK